MAYTQYSFYFWGKQIPNHALSWDWNNLEMKSCKEDSLSFIKPHHLHFETLFFKHSSGATAVYSLSWATPEALALNAHQINLQRAWLLWSVKQLYTLRKPRCRDTQIFPCLGSVLFDFSQAKLKNVCFVPILFFLWLGVGGKVWMAFCFFLDAWITQFGFFHSRLSRKYVTYAEVVILFLNT